MEKQTLLLHAALGSKTQLISLCSKLNSYFNIPTFDFEGHGETPSEKEFSAELFIQKLLDYIEKNKLNTFIGCSMRGYVALNYALNYAKGNPKK